VVVREGQSLRVADSKIDSGAQRFRGLDDFFAEVDPGDGGAALSDAPGGPARSCGDVENVFAGLWIQRVDRMVDGISDPAADLVVLLSPGAPSAGILNVGRKDGGLCRLYLRLCGHGGLLWW